MRIKDLSDVRHVFFDHSILSERLKVDFVGSVCEKEVRVALVGPEAMIIENKYLVIGNRFCVISVKEMYGDVSPNYVDNIRAISDSMMSVTVSQREEASDLITKHNAMPYKFSREERQIYSIDLYVDKEDYLEWTISK